MSLHLDSEYASSFEDFLERPVQVENLFVITHLGQLKQMEILISRKWLINNGLVVLYTFANFSVPQIVHNQVNTSLFEFVVFLEIPFKINQDTYRKLNIIDAKYRMLLKYTQPKSLYLNSFEGHYAILATLAHRLTIKNILVEEGTATYKLLIMDNDSLIDQSINYEFLKDKFIDTVGTTELFKKTVKYKNYIKDVIIKTYTCYHDIIADQRVQRKLIDVFGRSSIKSSKQPFLKFDKIYASFPNLIQSSFEAKDIERFSMYETISDEDLMLAQNIVNKYNITNKDVLYVSQKYGLNSTEYAKMVFEIVSRLIDIEKQRVFIKLHPKETMEVQNSFKVLCQASKGKFILIEDNKFLIEPVIKVSGLEMIIGLTSTTLVYAPLINKGVRSVSIAQSLIDKISKSKQNVKGSLVIEKHLKIIRVFDNIEFI